MTTRTIYRVSCHLHPLDLCDRSYTYPFGYRDQKRTLDFRVLIRLSVRTVHLGVTPPGSRSSLDLFPSKDRNLPVGLAPSPHALSVVTTPKRYDSFVLQGLNPAKS